MARAGSLNSLTFDESMGCGWRITIIVVKIFIELPIMREIFQDEIISCATTVRSGVCCVLVTLNGELSHLEARGGEL